MIKNQFIVYLMIFIFGMSKINKIQKNGKNLNLFQKHKILLNFLVQNICMKEYKKKFKKKKMIRNCKCQK